MRVRTVRLHPAPPFIPLHARCSDSNLLHEMLPAFSPIFPSLRASVLVPFLRVWFSFRFSPVFVAVLLKKYRVAVVSLVIISHARQ